MPKEPYKKNEPGKASDCSSDKYDFVVMKEKR